MDRKPRGDSPSRDVQEKAAKKNRRDFWRLIRKHNLDAQSFRIRHKEVRT